MTSQLSLIRNLIGYVSPIRIISRVRPMITSTALAAMFATFVITTPAATYTGTNTGAIPDGTAAAQVNCGAPRDIQFSVSGFTGTLGALSVSFTMAPAHPWAGDLAVSLIAPDTTSHLLFSRIGATTPTGNGDNANFDGTYTFNDGATQNIWSIAASNNGTGFDLTNGAYRTQAAGPGANADPGPAFTNLNSTFGGMADVNVNGVWTLRFLDCASGNTGGVSAASLTIVPTSAGPASLSGRVTSATGRGISGATITVSGNDGEHTAMTNSFGYYIFRDLDSGQAYIVSVAARRYTFSQASIFVGLNDNVSNANFVADR